MERKRNRSTFKGTDMFSQDRPISLETHAHIEVVARTKACAITIGLSLQDGSIKLSTGYSGAYIFLRPNGRIWFPGYREVRSAKSRAVGTYLQVFASVFDPKTGVDRAERQLYAFVTNQPGDVPNQGDVADSGYAVMTPLDVRRWLAMFCYEHRVGQQLQNIVHFVSPQDDEDINAVTTSGGMAVGYDSDDDMLIFSVPTWVVVYDAPRAISGGNVDETSITPSLR